MLDAAAAPGEGCESASDGCGEFPQGTAVATCRNKASESGAGEARGKVHGGPGPKSLQFACSVSGQATDFVITDFGSQLFIVITQSAKIGSLIEATSTEMQEGGQRVYDVKVIFGDRRAEHYRSYARALIELITKQSSKSLLLGIALKEHSLDSFKQIVSELRARIVSTVMPPLDEDDGLPSEVLRDMSIS
eukprot:TRINITY_DN55869_c0_g1_i1.p1 TRINITY_DN55869_c0_g1~~TRINITY_DN55869_c0_g1_i1.p1  ORF type:complete len:211 (-),score=39.22 TRINITY_DN55869_c0_g1_i1:292-864(-)